MYSIYTINTNTVEWSILYDESSNRGNRPQWPLLLILQHVFTHFPVTHPHRKICKLLPPFSTRQNFSDQSLQSEDVLILPSQMSQQTENFTWSLTLCPGCCCPLLTSLNMIFCHLTVKMKLCWERSRHTSDNTGEVFCLSPAESWIKPNTDTLQRKHRLQCVLVFSCSYSKH